MKEKNNIWVNLILLGLSIIGYFISILLFKEGSTAETVSKYSLAVGGTTIINIVSFIYYEWKYLCLLFRTQLWKRNRVIRVSLSYLYRIKVDNKFLLVRSGRIKNQFQPVGGVYKYFKEAKPYLDEFDFMDDRNIPIDNGNKNDLRIRIKAKHLIPIMKWYHSRKEREVSAWREFCEELVRCNVLSSKNFPYIQYRYLRTKKIVMTYSKYFKCYEYKEYDIFEPIFNKVQEQEIIGLSKIENNYLGNIIWVDENIIETLGYNSEGKKLCDIGEHTEFIL